MAATSATATTPVTTPAPAPAAAPAATTAPATATAPVVPAASAATAAATAAAAAAAGAFASASLYVGDLNHDVNEALLFEIFNGVGPVASVRVCRDASTRRSLGYAYVNFHRLEDAERALETMNYKAIRGRVCRIMWSHRDPSLRRSGKGNIFVKHLHKSIDHKTLYDTFSLFGNILSCKVAMNQKLESLGYGFVHYESEESAKTAIEKVDGKMISGQTVSVGEFKSKSERGGNKSTYTNVFVKNLPGDITKEQLEGIFVSVGKITSSVVNTNKEDKSKAFGFVNFATPEEAIAAVEKFHKTDYNGRELYVGKAQKRDERSRFLTERYEQQKIERAKKWQGTNLYIKNISDETDDEKLSSEFSKFGNITSAKVMRDVNGKSKGFAFVCYSSADEATKAVTEMNGRMYENKPLYVALAQRKADRHAQLQAQHASRNKMGMGPAMGMHGVGMGGVGMGGVGMPGVGVGMPGVGMGGVGMPGVGVNVGMPYGQAGPFFPQLQARNQFPYGQFPGMNRFNPAAAALMMRPGMPMNYQLMPANQRMPGVGVGAANVVPGMVGVGGVGVPPQGVVNQNRQPRQNQQGRQARQPGQPKPGQLAQPFPGQGQAQGQGQPQSNIRYADNVRNRQAAQTQAQGQAQGLNQAMSTPAQAQGQALNQAMSTPADMTMMIPSSTEPLTIKALAAAPEEMRKQMIGERLFPLIKLQQPELAGKITGMLLEMDNSELIHLLETPVALQEKIGEAMAVLKSAEVATATSDEQNAQ